MAGKQRYYRSSAGLKGHKEGEESCLDKREGPRHCYLSSYLLRDALSTKCHLILIPTYEASESPHFTQKEAELTKEQSWRANPGYAIPKSVCFSQQHSNTTWLQSTGINTKKSRVLKKKRLETGFKEGTALKGKQETREQEPTESHSFPYACFVFYFCFSNAPRVTPQHQAIT